MMGADVVVCFLSSPWVTGLAPRMRGFFCLLALPVGCMLDLGFIQKGDLNDGKQQVPKQTV